jgi:lysyl-tRNA synthetase class II
MARFRPLSRLGEALNLRSPNGSNPNVNSVHDGKNPLSVLNGPSSNSESVRSSTESARGRREAKRREKQEKLERQEREKEEIEARRRSEEERIRALEDPDILKRYGGIDEPVHPMELISIEKAATLPVGTEVTFRCRIQHQRRISEALDFLLLRDKTHTIQGVLSRTSPHMIKWVQRLHSESLVEIHGTLQKPVAPVKSASHSDIEVDIFSIHLVAAANNLPWDNYHAPEALHQRMQDRILDLRHPSNQALFRIRAMITRTFRQALEDKQFMEIQTPKLQPAATESGAEVFKVNYFGRRAFLAQSPQLAKQMTVSADFGRVFEVSSCAFSFPSAPSLTNMCRSAPSFEQKTRTLTVT